jgi:hypothetical protein
MRLLVLAGSCTIFGAKLAAGTVAATAAGGEAKIGDFHDVHAVPPYGPLGLEAAGRPTTAASLDRRTLRAHGVGCGGDDASAAQRRLVDTLSGELATNRQPPVACVVCLRRWRGAGCSAHADARGSGGAPPQAQWLKGRGLDALIRNVLGGGGAGGGGAGGGGGGGRIVFPWSECLLQPVKVSGPWQAAADRVTALAGDRAGAVAALVGAKGSGKSTMGRYLVNRLLARHPQV